MCLTAAHIGQIAAVALQLGLGSVEAVQGLITDGHDLGGLEAAGSAPLLRHLPRCITTACSGA